jgi:colanic acid biosynthesis glycosyl transferase WcaI
MPAATVPRLVLLEQYFYPEGWGGAEIPRDLAAHFARLGWRVEVICGTEQYAPVDSAGTPDPQVDGVVIRRVPKLPGGGNVHSRRVLRLGWFGLWAAAWLLARRPPDLFLSQTNPPGAVLLVALASRVWRKPFILIAMDLYPEVLFASGTLASRGLVARLAARVFGWAYRAATVVVALGPDMARQICAKGVSPGLVVEISNWATGSLALIRGGENRLRDELALGPGLTLVYSGNLGVGHEFETLLKGFALARREKPDLNLVFFGDGARLGEVRRAVRDLGLESAVRFGPFVAADRLPETLGLADVGVVTLREGFQGLMVPSKVLGYMARGIPVLFIGPSSDVDSLLARHGCGLSVRSGEPDALARVILELHADRERLDTMGRAGRQAYEAGLTRAHALTQYESTVRACLAAGRG